MIGSVLWVLFVLGLSVMWIYLGITSEGTAHKRRPRQGGTVWNDYGY